MKFDLEKLKAPKVSEAFEAMIGRKFALLTALGSENIDMDA